MDMRGLLQTLSYAWFGGRSFLPGYTAGNGLQNGLHVFEGHSKTLYLSMFLEGL